MDNSHKSSCPICQRWFMVLFLKSEAKELALVIYLLSLYYTLNSDIYSRQTVINTIQLHLNYKFSLFLVVVTMSMGQ